jgi:hypothetical protein
MYRLKNAKLNHQLHQLDPQCSLCHGIYDIIERIDCQDKRRLKYFVWRNISHRKTYESCAEQAG